MNQPVGDRPTRRAVTSVGLAVLLTAGLSGCGQSLEEQGGGESGQLVIGSAGFTESQIMAELYSKVLSDAGYRTTIKQAQNRELYEPALEKGQIDVVPEYAATFAEFLNAKKNGPQAKPVASNDVRTTVRELRKLSQPRGLRVLEAGQAVDQNAFAVTTDFARKHRLATLSDLGRSGQRVKLAAGDECDSRPFCSPGLRKTYGIALTGVDPKGVGTTQSKQAVKDGVDQLVLTTTTDATLKDFNLTLLDDDKGLQNSDNVLPVVNGKKAGGKRLTDTLDKLTRALTTPELAELNRKVDAERQKPKDVAADYLKAKNLL